MCTGGPNCRLENMMDKLLIGVDYYPEMWGEEYLDGDIEIMKDMGINVVRVGEFAWSRMESEEGKFDFSWLKSAVEKFRNAGIDVILCTPTNTPPLWAFRKYPEIIQMNRKYERIQTGIRGHRCYTSKKFRELSKIIIEKLCLEFKDFSNVISWQLDNELEANFCSCPECTASFRNYLKDKYGTLENINSAFGNSVWSGEYSDYEEILTPPDYPDNWLNPAYMLDYNRFASESVSEYAEFQAGIIRGIIPDAKITTNTWFCQHTVDGGRLFENLDYVSYDNYPSTDVDDLDSRAYRLDMMRGIKDKNFCIMEQLSGAVGSWMPMVPTPTPGMIKGYALQCLAHGADSILHFRFRTAKSGAEMFWHGLLNQSDREIPRTPKYKEFKSLCKEINDLSNYELCNSEVISEVGILYNHEDDVALQIQPQSDGMNYMKTVKAYYDAFQRLGVGVDFVNLTRIVNLYRGESNSEGANFTQQTASPENPLTKYRLIVLPNQFVENKILTELVDDYVRNGGRVVITPRSGVKDENNNHVTEVLPGRYRKLAGAKVCEYNSLGKKTGKIVINDSEWEEYIKALKNEENGFYEKLKTVPFKNYNPISDNIEKKFEIKNDESVQVCSQWCDLLEPESSKTLARYYNSFYDLFSAVTEHKYLNGFAYYIGTYLDEISLNALLALILSKAGVQVEYLPKGIEVTIRRNEKFKYLFLFNNNAETVEFIYRNKEYSLKAFEMLIEM